MQPSDRITPEQNELLKRLQCDSFNYFVHMTNLANGLTSST